jgi:hypothetical protein
MKKHPRQKYSDQQLAEEALRYSRRVDFQKGSRNMYKAALARGLLDSVCGHMEARQSWTQSKVKKEALRYNTRGDFAEFSRSAYTWASRKGVLDDICSHMMSKEDLRRLATEKMRATTIAKGLEKAKVEIAEFGYRIVGDYKDRRTATEIECAKGHQWSCSIRAIVTEGQRCADCDRDKRKIQINHELESRGIELVGPFLTVNDKTDFKCICGHEWVTTPNSVTSGGTGCPVCSKIESGLKRRLTESEVKDRVAARGFTFIGPYGGTHETMIVECPVGHKVPIYPTNLFKGQGCGECSGRLWTKAKVNKALKVRKIRLVSDFVTSNTVSEFECQHGHRWKTRPTEVIHRTGCPWCSHKARLNKAIINKRLMTRGICLTGEFFTVDDRTRFECGNGHSWETTPASVLSGTGCKACKGIRQLDTEEDERILDTRGFSMSLLGESIYGPANFKCSEGHSWEVQSAYQTLTKTGCALCAGKAPLTKEIVNDRLFERGFQCVDEFNGVDNKAWFICPEGHHTHQRPAGILRGRGCAVCADRVPLSLKEVNKRLQPKGIVCVGGYSGTNKQASFRCSAGHEYRAYVNNQLQFGCLECSGNKPLSKEQVDARLAASDAKMVGEFRGTNAHVRFRCSKGHEWTTRPTMIINNGTGCPTCHAGGYSPGKPGYLYYLRLDCEYSESPIYKIGITNKSVEQRFSALEDLERIWIVDLQYFEDGEKAILKEREIKHRFKAYRYDGPKFMKGGGETEMFVCDVLGLDIELTA